MPESPVDRDLYMKKKKLNYLNCLRIWNTWRGKYVNKYVKSNDIKNSHPHNKCGHIVNEKNISREWKHLP